MTESVSRILTELQGLSDDERAEVAFAALESLGPVEEQQGNAWEAELQRRGDEIRSGQAEGRPADEVFARLKGRRS